MPGAVAPETPAKPEYVQAYVYAPKGIMGEIERNGGTNPVPSLVQIIIRELGVPTLEKFDRARAKIWNFPRNENAPPPLPLPKQEGMPMAIPDGSSRYLFYGQKVRSMPDPSAYFGMEGYVGDKSQLLDDDSDNYFSAISEPESEFYVEDG